VNLTGATNKPAVISRWAAMFAAARTFIKRLNRNSARADYEAVERDLFGGQYRYSNKNDDDLRIFSPPR
jgi:hypothetical protein